MLDRIVQWMADAVAGGLEETWGGVAPANARRPRKFDYLDLEGVKPENDPGNVPFLKAALT